MEDDRVLSVMDKEAEQLLQIYSVFDFPVAKSEDRTKFGQEEPNFVCQDRHPDKSKCRNPRCSLQCRCNFAAKESAILEARLCSLPSRFNLYFGNVSIKGILRQSDHRLIRSEFLKRLRHHDQEKNSVSKIRATSEIGDDDTIHYHYAVFSTKKLSDRAMKSLWKSVAGGRKTILDHDVPRKGIRAASKYMFKDLRKVRERKVHIRLFDYGTLPITWGSKNFFTFNGRSKDDIWNECKLRWYGPANNNAGTTASKVPFGRKTKRDYSQMSFVVPMEFTPVLSCLECAHDSDCFTCDYHSIIAWPSTRYSRGQIRRDCTRRPSRLRCRIRSP